MTKLPKILDHLTQSDYDVLTLNAIAELTEERSSFEFSVSEIAKHLKMGNSVNRTMFSIKTLLEEGLISDSCLQQQYLTEVVEENFSTIIEQNESRFYITAQGLNEYDTSLAVERNVLDFISIETSPHLRLLALIYSKTRSVLELFCRINIEELPSEFETALQDLQVEGLIKAFFLKDAWVVTESGRQFLKSESEIRDISLEAYLNKIGNLSYAELTNLNQPLK